MANTDEIVWTSFAGPKEGSVWYLGWIDGVRSFRYISGEWVELDKTDPDSWENKATKTS